MISPYLSARAKLVNSVQAAQSTYLREVRLLRDRPKVAADWKAILATAEVKDGVLKTNSAEAVSQAYDACYNIARDVRFGFQTFTPDRVRQEKKESDFQVIRLNVTGIGSTAALYRFVSALEHSNLPLRIEDMKVTSRQPGTGDLNIALTLSTIIFTPTTTSRPAPQAQPQGDNI